MGKFLLALAMLVVAACATTGTPAAGEGAPRDGRALYESSCQRCHALFMPASYDAQEWAFFVRKYGRRARLTAPEQDLVAAYLFRNARP